MTRGVRGPDCCHVDGCDRNHYGNGMCQMHYNRFRRHGTTDKPDEAARFWAKVERGAGCWPWLGSISPAGYGRFSTDARRTVPAYRYAYEGLIGPVPEGLHLDHLCRNRACVNPLHLEPVTPKENYLRGFGAPAMNARKTACKRGHDFTPENTYMKGGRRVCRECKRSNDRARRQSMQP